MLRFIDQLVGMPIVGIRSSEQISSTIEAIINPRKLCIEAFYCEPDRVSDTDMVLFTTDIREVGHLGIIVDSEDVIMPTADLVRLEEITALNFQLIGKNIVTESGKKLGKIENYTIEDTTFRIEKLYARPQMFKTISTNDFIVSRRQIASVNDKNVIVKDALAGQNNRAQRPFFNPLSS